MSSEFFLQVFVTLLVVIDPFAVVPVYISLTHRETLIQRRRIALKATSISAIILLSFAFLGESLLDMMDISEPAFRIAGGFLLLLAAIEMVLAQHSGLRKTTGEEEQETIERDDISVFPLAIPLIAGPGALTSVVVLMRQAKTLGGASTQSGVILIVLLVLVINYLCLLIGERLMRLLGVTGTNVLTRVFGIILAALAVQSMLRGLLLALANAGIGK